MALYGRPRSAARISAACCLIGALILLPAAAKASEPLGLAILEFGFLDTSYEPDDQAADHEARLGLISQELHQLFAESEDFEVVTLELTCQPDDSDCIIESARDAGAELVLAGTIHKGSSMLIQLWAGAFETTRGERVFFREMSLRGDTDEAWLRGARSVAEDLQEEHFTFAR